MTLSISRLLRYPMFSLIRNMYLLRPLSGVILLLVLAAHVSASPWISVGETRLKQHLHLLNDTGVINLSLTTWPIMWADVEKAIKSVDGVSLNVAQRNALQELRFELRFQTKKEMKRSLELAASSSRTVFRDFDSKEFEKGRLSHHFDWDGESMAFKLQANATTDPGEDLLETQFYGSYIAGVMGEWVLGVGAIDRWWGAGNQSSLILTNNARPVPALFFRTKQSQQFETPLLSWLGDWHFTSFIGQLESNRVIPEAKLTGIRFTFQPFDDLEIGLSRAMMWGGDGRSDSISTFFKSLTSQGENTSEQAGNQLAGYDVRYSFLRTPAYGMAVYAQMIGEDEAGYLPSKFVVQAGLEANFSLLSGNNLNLFLELTDTTAGAIGGKQFDTAYEHSVYKTGYRHRGRAIAATYDNDAKVLAFGLSHHQLEHAQSVSAVLSYLKLNDDGSAGSNTVTGTAVDLYQLSLAYQRLALGGKLKLVAQYLSELPVLLEDQHNKLAVSAAWTYRF